MELEGILPCSQQLDHNMRHFTLVTVLCSLLKAVWRHFVLSHIHSVHTNRVPLSLLNICAYTCVQKVGVYCTGKFSGNILVAIKHPFLLAAQPYDLPRSLLVNNGTYHSSLLAFPILLTIRNHLPTSSGTI
jgi:hypothetical protein